MSTGTPFSGVSQSSLFPLVPAGLLAIIIFSSIYSGNGTLGALGARIMIYSIPIGGSIIFIGIILLFFNHENLSTLLIKGGFGICLGSAISHVILKIFILGCVGGCLG